MKNNKYLDFKFCILRFAISGGFTLLEVLLSVTLLAIVLAAVYSTFFLAHKAIEGEDESLLKLQESRTALDIMRREIESLRYNTDKKNTAFTLEDRDAYGKQTSRIKFTAFVPLVPGLSSISYYVSEKDNKLSLYKEIRSANRPPENIEPAEVAENIESFTIEAKGTDGRWTKTWDASLVGRAPSELRIKIGVPLKNRVIALTEVMTPMIRQ